MWACMRDPRSASPGPCCGILGGRCAQENVEIVRRGFEAINARDLDRYYVETVDPEIEWQTSAGQTPTLEPIGGCRRISVTWRGWIEGFDGFHGGP